ncbi:CapA family protein [Flexilinea flocculi]|uniref:Bacterial capsule synthesis protein PGA_cap n=1 Tax=Flexilinea flocculi TaxID=1678840 RepID=A0A0K8PBH1_9CHLR|nr:CapA family protein [Flexilinea flocculi]NMB93740.1 hypothetical protein [Flexilinea flocculi]GAP39495.1 bacterial capsule synthesis protein PGA_cap [Flexilinea flocculi]
MKLTIKICGLYFLLILALSWSEVSAQSLQTWIDPALPSNGKEMLSSEIRIASDRDTADCRIELASDPNLDPNSVTIRWVYVLAAPYATPIDDISLQAVQKVWHGETDTVISQFVLDEETYHVFSKNWGEADPDTVKVLSKDALLAETWQKDAVWAIIPFEAMDPRWKMIQVDGTSPFDIDFDPERYALSVVWQFRPRNKIRPCAFSLPKSNFDRGKMTSLTLTGTTAMVRQLAYHIEEDGLLYPVKNIAAVLSASDITHVSNEVSFSLDCPPAVPLRREARFCSDPRYIRILEAIGADVIELTGNHVLDWGTEPFLYSLDLYHKKGYQVYGGGLNADEGQKPVFFEHHGNRIAILGCNAIGPENILAGSDTPGAAPCDLEKMKQQITDLKDAGWLVVVTFQHLEWPYYDVTPLQSHDFYEIAETGPAIISGSQAHIPQGMTFVGKTFIHFGLGNLLFDQMSDVERDSFFDRHYFYDGRYIGNVLETIRLENYSQPRFLQADERESFLAMIFDTCSWNRVF